MLHAGLGYLRIVRTEWGDVIVRTMLARGTFHSVGFFLKGAAFSSGSSLKLKILVKKKKKRLIKE